MIAIPRSTVAARVARGGSRRRWPRPSARRCMLGAIAAGWLAFGAFWWRLLPQPLFSTPQSYVLEARDGTLLSARIAADGQWRFPAAGEVPVKFRRALLTYEDKRFERHRGVDPLALARAVKLDVAAGHVVSGGSTLTMQLARLADGKPGRSVREKLGEMLLAQRLEWAYDKDQLLSLYAANAPFGGNVVGLEAASWRYFGRGPAELSWAEAATLAVLPNDPALVHVARNRGRLQDKRDGLLRRMGAAGILTAMDLDLALSEPLVAEPHDLPDLAPHLLETLRVQFPARHRLRTTLDARLQARATAQTQEHTELLARQQVDNAASIIIDNHTLEVLAYVGNGVSPHFQEMGADPKWVKGAGAVDIIRRPRSTGSILKPFLYAAMLEDGALNPRMLVPDVPTHFEGFTPENFDRQYRGAVRADEALAHSLNIPAVRELQTYGVARFADLLRDAGMTTLARPADEYGLTLVLGGAEGNLWDVASMYASLAAMASATEADPTPRFRNLTVLAGEQSTPRGETPITPGSAWLTLDALLEVPRPGAEGAWRSFASARRIAWKTGTSFGLRDGWAIGATSRYTVGVWVGNASGEGRPGLTGSTMAAPLMFGLFDNLPVSPWFDRPTYALRAIDTCVDDGYLRAADCETERTWIPRNSHFDLQSPHNLRVHLDASGAFRVDSDCESPLDMRHVTWFVLPPAQEYYYRRAHAEYRALPNPRADCAAARDPGTGALALLYPDANARVLIPQELDGRRGRTVFEAVARRRDATIYWHLDGQYLGETHTFHQQSLDIDPGEHILTLVDDTGDRIARKFQVLATR